MQEHATEYVLLQKMCKKIRKDGLYADPIVRVFLISKGS